MNEEARKRALRLLEKRDYSRKMLQDKLTEKGATEPEAREVTDWLCGLGVIDDARYAELAARHYARKGYGLRRIKDELRRRGIPRELWEEALAGLPETDDSLDRLLASRLRDSDGSPEELRRARDHLLRRGYSYGEINEALERYQAEKEDEE